MAIPAYANSGTAATTTTLSSITPGIPTGTAAGDLLICVALVQKEATMSMTGWTLLWHKPILFQSDKKAIFWRVATGSDPNTIATTVAPAGTTFFAQISRYTGAKTSGTVVGLPFVLRNQSASTVKGMFGSIPIHGNNSLCVVFQHKSAAPSAISTGYTQRLNNTTQGYSLFDAGVASFGYSPAFSVTYGAAFSVDYCAFEIYSDVPNTRAYPYIAQQQEPIFGNAITSATVFFPTNMTVGNVLVVSCFASLIGVTLPAGWNQFLNVNVQSNCQFVFMWKVIDGTEGASLTFSFTVANPCIYAFELANSSTVSPFQSFRHRSANATAVSHPVPGLTPTQDNVLAVTYFNNGSSTAIEGLDLSNDGGTVWHRGQYQGLATGMVVAEGATAGVALTGFTETPSATATWFYIQFEIWPRGTNGPIIANRGTAVNGTIATSLTLTCPNIVAGDLLLASCANSGGVKFDDAPAGWTLLGRTVIAYAIAFYYKIADGTESGGTTTFTHNAGSSGSYGNIQVIKGHDPVKPFGRLSCVNIGNTSASFGGQHRLTRHNSLVIMSCGPTQNNWPATANGLWGSEQLNSANPGVGGFGFWTHQKGKIVQEYTDDFITVVGTGTGLSQTMGLWFVEILAAGQADLTPSIPYVAAFGYGGTQGAGSTATHTGGVQPPQRLPGDIECVLYYFPTAPALTMTSSGWHIYATNFSGLWLAWRVITGGEDDVTWPTINFSPGQSFFRYMPFLIARADRVAPFGTATTNSGTSTADAVPSVTTLRDNDMVLSVGFHQENPTTPAMSNFGKTLAMIGTGGTSPPSCLHVFEKTKAVAGAAGTDTMNIANAAAWANMTFEVNYPFGTLGNQAVIIG